jgi:predicted amidohydrolase
VAYANSTGQLNGINFMGESKIIGPDGIDIANANIGEKLISARLILIKSTWYEKNFLT